MKHLAVLLSGRGSNFEAIADSIHRGEIAATIAVVISNRPDARGVTLARERQIHTVVIPSRGVDREAYDRLLIEELQKHDIDLVCLAGYMRVLSATFVRAFRNRILNIHPSLLPAFPGLDPQHQALAYGVKVSGCTVHFVDEYLDAGPIILQAAVPVESEDTDETLAQRILQQEHRIYSQAIRIVLEGKYHIEERRVILD